MARKYRTGAKLTAMRKKFLSKRKAYTNRKRKAGTRPVVLTKGVPTGFPRKLIFKHKYAEQLALTSTTGVMAKYYFAANGLYDPNITGTGHQPLYFDQLTPIYDHYCVIGSRIKIKILPDSTITKPVQCVLFIDDNNASSATNAYTLIEQATGKNQLMSVSQTKPFVLTQNWSIKKYFSGNDYLENTDMQGTPTTNPAELSYFVLAIQDITQSLTVTLDFIVEIEYIAVWKEIGEMASS